MQLGFSCTCANGTNRDEVGEELKRLREVQRVESERVLELLAKSLGTLGFVKEVL